jgi:hypothetical protein
MTEIRVTCERFFPETGRKTKNGKDERMCIDVRKMYIKGDFLWTTKYEVNYLKRDGERKFYVKKLKPKKKELWPTLKLVPVQEIDVWEREGVFLEEAFIKWLSKITPRAESWVSELKFMQPTNLAA